MPLVVHELSSSQYFHGRCYVTLTFDRTDPMTLITLIMPIHMKNIILWQV